MSKKMISVVIPSYNEEKSVREMYDRLVAVFRDSLPAYDYEIMPSLVGSEMCNKRQPTGLSY